MKIFGFKIKPFIFISILSLLLTSSIFIIDKYYFESVISGQPKGQFKFRSLNLNSKIQVDCNIKFVTILCGQDSKESDDIAIELHRQINQSLVLLKSLLITFQNSTDCLKVIFVSDAQTHFETLKYQVLNFWDIKFKSRLQLQYVPLKYPPGTFWMRNLFRPCATLRLFLPDILVSYDSVIYIDTDIIFLRNPAHLWSEFESFRSNENILASMAPCLWHYGTSRNSIPFYGTSGLNAGIMLMNLTRMRNSHWTHKIRMVGQHYRTQIKLADQDMLNIYFAFHPNQLHILQCDWNFRPFQCHNGSHCLLQSHGISALHGNALSFTPKGPEPLFYTIYKIFLNTSLTSHFNLKNFIQKLDETLFEQLLELSNRRPSSPCAKLSGFKSMILGHFSNQEKL